MKTTLFSLAGLFIFILAISINSPVTAKTTTVEDIVIVDDTLKSKASAKECTPEQKAKCSTMSKKECKTKCASHSPKCCSSKSAVKSCCSKGKKK